jgi:hypothetical protein
MQNLLVVILITSTILAGVLLGGCAFGQAPGPVAENGVIEGEGTVHYVDLEGGFYGLTADTGARYYPIDLPESLTRDGIRVSFRVRVQPDVMTIVMWGTPVEVLEMTPL